MIYIEDNSITEKAFNSYNSDLNNEELFYLMNKATKEAYTAYLSIERKFLEGVPKIYPIKNLNNYEDLLFETKYDIVKYREEQGTYLGERLKLFIIPKDNIRKPLENNYSIDYLGNYISVILSTEFGENDIDYVNLIIELTELYIDMAIKKYVPFNKIFSKYSLVIPCHPSPIECEFAIMYYYFILRNLYNLTNKEKMNPQYLRTNSNKLMGSFHGGKYKKVCLIEHKELLECIWKMIKESAGDPYNIYEKENSHRYLLYSSIQYMYSIFNGTEEI